MKRQLIVLAALLSLGSAAFAQEKPKTGWRFTPMPNLGYSSDIGVTLGVYSDFYYYGDGSAYPNFLHHAGFAAAYTTKGSWYAHAYFDSPALIPGVRINATLTYRDALVNNFYGFNGIALFPLHRSGQGRHYGPPGLDRRPGIPPREHRRLQTGPL